VLTFVYLFMDKSVIAGKIKEARLQAGLTQTQLGEKIGTKKEGVSRIESGKHEIELSTLDKIAEALNCNLRIELEPK